VTVSQLFPIRAMKWPPAARMAIMITMKEKIYGKKAADQQ
jgi:hypothetical protein